MKRSTTALILTGLLAIAGLSLTNSARASGDDTAGALKATRQFYKALNQMFTGDLTAMKSVWSHADDVTYMGPTGGVERGWTQVLRNWEAQAAMKMGGKVEPRDVHAVVGADLAVVQDVEHGETRANGGVQKVSIRATNVFRLENGTWKMISHHTDILPFLNK